MSKAKKTATSPNSCLSFSDLVRTISGVNTELTFQARNADNVSLTLRNWLIGCHIAEYELRGEDQAAYGEKLLDSLAVELSRLKISNCNRRQLYRYLRFYRTFPGIVGALSPQSQSLLPSGFPLVQKSVGGAVPTIEPNFPGYDQQAILQPSGVDR